MKIPRYIRNQADWQYAVEGPGMGTVRAPTLGSAVSVAQNHASRSDLPGTWLVSECDDVVYTVKRSNNPFLVTTTPREA